MARTAAIVAALLCMSVPAQAESDSSGGRAGAIAAQPARGPAIAGGHDGRSAWMVAEYKQLQVRKRADPAARTLTIELRAGRDAVTVTLASGTVSVARGRQRLVVDSPEAFESLQSLLGGSFAIFATRAMLSELEETSALQAPEASLLGAAAFVASLVGDIDAPRRLADRFVAKHRGLFRQIRGGESCWAGYSKETTDSWNDLQSCMDEAADDGFFSGAYQRLACNGTWLLRSESAWFEYLKCLSPLTSLPG